MNETPATLAQRLRKHLKNDLLDFWLKNGIDSQYGGYLTSLDYFGRVYNYDKYSVTQTRMVYAFAEGYRFFGDERYRQAARQGFEFYTTHFWDDVYQGWYHGMNRTGAYLWEPFKRTYDFAFVIYCFAEYFGATQDTRALDAIQKTLDLLDQKIADPVHRGWFESFERDWSAKKQAGKTFNVCMHLLEAMLAGFEKIDQQQFLPRLEMVLDLILSRCVIKPENLPVEFFAEDWRPTLQKGQPVINYGHVMETAFFFLRLAELFRRDDLMRHALRFIEFSMKFGFNPQVGMACFGSPRGDHDLYYYYWNQSETIAALARAFRMTNDERFWNWLVKMVELIFRHFADSENGEWIARVDPDGQPGDIIKGAIHKACYHLTQAITSVIREIEQ